MKDPKNTSHESPNKNGKTAKSSEFSATTNFVMLQTLAPYHSVQQAITKELDQADLTHDQRMALIQMQKESCDKGSKHVATVIVTISVAVGVVSVALCQIVRY